MITEQCEKHCDDACQHAESKTFAAQIKDGNTSDKRHGPYFHWHRRKNTGWKHQHAADETGDQCRGNGLDPEKYLTLGVDITGQPDAYDPPRRVHSRADKEQR